MPGTFIPPPWVSDPDMQHGTCMTHVPWCMPGSLTNSFLWSRWRGKILGILGACAIRNFTYLARGPWAHLEQYHELVPRSPAGVWNVYHNCNFKRSSHMTNEPTLGNHVGSYCIYMTFVDIACSFQRAANVTCISVVGRIWFHFITSGAWRQCR